VADALTLDAGAVLTVRLLRLATRATLHAAHSATARPTAGQDGPSSFRELTIVSLHNEVGSDALGWGECAALNAPTYTAEWARGAYEMLTSGQPIDVAQSPMAAAAIEMATLDAELRAEERSLADKLGCGGTTSTAGAVVGLAPIPSMLAEVTELVDAGYRRVKCKVAPGRLIEPIRAVTSEFPGLEVQIDANGSLGFDDLRVLFALRDLGITAVEQPFAIGDRASAARLVADTDLTVIADESITSVNELWQVAQDQAATAVAIKPPRVGGLANALTMLDAARRAGLAASVGGMLESGFGRHQLAALAGLNAFTITGDVSPASRWLRIDPFPDIKMVDGTIQTPSVVGVAPPPDLDILEAVTVNQAVVEVPTITAG